LLTTLDYSVITIYLVAVVYFGVRIAGHQTSTDDYFLGNRNLPWWVVCFSIVATETSTLTIIGLPAISYGGTLTFLQLTLGYLLGRTVVSLVLLPRYHERNLVTTYEFLGLRYGDVMRGAASVTFLVTRLLADGVRLFASAIPLKVIATSAGFNVSYFEIISVLGLITVFYTLVGGIRAVVWMDVVQLMVYLLGGCVAIVLLNGEADPDWWSNVLRAGKATVLDMGLDRSLPGILTQAYILPTAVLGGAVFSVASHGTDQLIVQRLLACRSLRDSQRALVGSAIVVMLQFALFLLIGLLLWSHYGGSTVNELGLSRTDEIFPKFIVEELPAGLSGLLLAGIIAAAMSTLSSTVNSLASSSLMDIYRHFSGATVDDTRSLVTSRLLTLFWGAALIGFASLFENSDNAVVELGLTIASYTYGGLLGVFLLGILVRQSNQSDALVAFAVTIVSMVLIVFGVWHSSIAGWQFVFNPTDAEIMERDLVSIAWPWYPVIGSAITLCVGVLRSRLRHR
jgi:SSS family solute:Na+ symporter